MLSTYGIPSGSPGTANSPEKATIDYLRIGTNAARVIGSPLGITIYSTERY